MADLFKTHRHISLTLAKKGVTLDIVQKAKSI